MNLYPFTLKNIYALAIGLLCFFAFYYWEFNFHPIVNIVFKSALVSLVYVGLIYKANLSPEIKTVIEKQLKRITR
jgi:hypothetical protein